MPIPRFWLGIGMGNGRAGVSDPRPVPFRMGIAMRLDRDEGAVG
jgi:hypothetical protein